MHDLIVVGGGLAGLAATLYATRRHLNVLLVSTSLGGKTNFHMELPTPTRHLVLEGAEVVEEFKKELERQGFSYTGETVDRVCRHQDGFAVRTHEGSNFLSRSVIVASGVKHQRLNVPGEKNYLMRGLSYSALSYAPHLKSRTATIIGKDKLAIRAAAELALTAEQVYLIGPAGNIFETPLGKKVRAAKNVTILEGYWVTEVRGDEFARSVAVAAPGGETREVKADVFFIEMRVIPNSQMVLGLVDLEPEGHIKVDERNRTNVPGIFAAGDVSHTYMEQVWVAVGGGAKAALSAYEYLLPKL